MPAGRPRKYGPKILEIMEDYISNCSKHGDLFPSIAGCAAVCNVTRGTLHKWDRDEDKPEFSHMLEQLLIAQERSCLKNGANGEYNSTIAKLVLSKHGYHDSVKSENKNENKNYNVDVKELTDEQLNEIISGDD